MGSDKKTVDYLNIFQLCKVKAVNTQSRYTNPSQKFGKNETTKTILVEFVHIYQYYRNKIYLDDNLKLY